MDQSIIYAVMIALGFLMAMAPFAVFTGLGTILGAAADDARLFLVFLLGSAILMFAGSFGAFALIQKLNCGSVKNYQQISANAGIATALQTGMALLATFIPFLRNIVVNLLPPDLDPHIRDAVGYSYFNFWGALFGTAIGGAASAAC